MGWGVYVVPNLPGDDVILPRQHQMWPPSAWITDSILWGIPSNKALIWALSSYSHSCWILVQKSSKDAKLHLSSYYWTIPHAFSIGLRSGLLPGHLSRGIPSEVRRGSTPLPMWGLALSCWKMKLCLNLDFANTCLMEGIRFTLKRFKYSAYETPLCFWPCLSVYNFLSPLVPVAT